MAVSEPVEQLSCVCLPCQSAEHHVCHEGVEEHLAGFDQVLEVAAHAPVPTAPMLSASVLQEYDPWKA
jgi:hypothetical protein